MSTRVSSIKLNYLCRLSCKPSQRAEEEHRKIGGAAAKKFRDLAGAQNGLRFRFLDEIESHLIANYCANVKNNGAVPQLFLRGRGWTSPESREGLPFLP
jgi:hypothetical protein